MSRAHEKAITHPNQVRRMEAKLLEAKTLEIHYDLDNDIHAIDAKAFYACQQELVGLIDYVAKQLDIEVDIKTIVRKEEGGVIEYLSLASEHLPTVASVAIGVLVGIIAPGLKEGFKQFITHSVTQMQKSKEEKVLDGLRLKEERLKLEKSISDLEVENTAQLTRLNNEGAIQKRRGTFYASAKSVDALNRIEFGLKDSPESKEYIWNPGVLREEFDSFITAPTDIEPFEDDDALIEVLAPVLMKERKRSKWRGIYNNNKISFSILDKEFLQNVWSRKVVFSNGSSLQCILEINREVNEDGVIVPKDYRVVEVLDISNNGTPQPLPPRKKKTLPHSDEPDLFSGQYDQA